MRSSQAWRKFGARDPYYGVFAHADYRAENMDVVRKDAFIELGRAQVERYVTIHKERSPTAAFEGALDFGCGVGRLSLNLARHFSHVHSVDVSPDILAELMENARRLGVGNITTHETLQDVQSGSVDLVVSEIVLQHIEQSHGYAIIQDMLRVLRPNGTLAIEILYGSKLSGAVRAGRWLKEHVPGVQLIVNVLLRRPLWQPGMQMNVYSMNRVIEIIFGSGVKDLKVIHAEPDAFHLGALLVCTRPSEGVSMA